MDILHILSGDAVINHTQITAVSDDRLKQILLLAGGGKSVGRRLYSDRITAIVAVIDLNQTIMTGKSLKCY